MKGRTAYMLLTSRMDLRAAMTERRMSYAVLSRVVGALGHKRPDGTPLVVNRSFLGALGAGSRTSCTPEMARAIEDALGARAGSLFKAKVTR